MLGMNQTVATMTPTHPSHKVGDVGGLLFDGGADFSKISEGFHTQLP